MLSMLLLLLRLVLVLTMVVMLLANICVGDDVASCARRMFWQRRSVEIWVLWVLVEMAGDESAVESRGRHPPTQRLWSFARGWDKGQRARAPPDLVYEQG